MADDVENFIKQHKLQLLKEKEQLYKAEEGKDSAPASATNGLGHEDLRTITLDDLIKNFIHKQKGATKTEPNASARSGERTEIPAEVDERGRPLQGVNFSAGSTVNGMPMATAAPMQDNLNVNANNNFVMDEGNEAPSSPPGDGISSAFNEIPIAAKLGAYEDHKSRLAEERRREYNDLLRRARGRRLAGPYQQNGQSPTQQQASNKENDSYFATLPLNERASAEIRKREERNKEYNTFLNKNASNSNKNKHSPRRDRVPEEYVDSSRQPVEKPRTPRRGWATPLSYEEILDRKRREESHYRRYDDPEYSRPGDKAPPRRVEDHTYPRDERDRWHVPNDRPVSGRRHREGEKRLRFSPEPRSPRKSSRDTFQEHIERLNRLQMSRMGQDSDRDDEDYGPRRRERSPPPFDPQQQFDRASPRPRTRPYSPTKREDSARRRSDRVSSAPGQDDKRNGESNRPYASLPMKDPPEHDIAKRGKEAYRLELQRQMEEQRDMKRKEAEWRRAPLPGAEQLEAQRTTSLPAQNTADNLSSNNNRTSPRNLHASTHNPLVTQSSRTQLSYAAPTLASPYVPRVPSSRMSGQPTPYQLSQQAMSPQLAQPYQVYQNAVPSPAAALASIQNEASELLMRPPANPQIHPSLLHLLNPAVASPSTLYAGHSLYDYYGSTNPLDPASALPPGPAIGPPAPRMPLFPSPAMDAPPMPTRPPPPVTGIGAAAPQPTSPYVGALPSASDDPRADEAKKRAYQSELTKQIQEFNERKQRAKEEQEQYDRKIEAEMSKYDPFNASPGQAAPNTVQDVSVTSAAIPSPSSRNEPTYARGGHGIFGEPQTVAQKTVAERYKEDLEQQIAEKKVKQEEEKRRLLEEEMREAQRIEEQRQKLQQEYEEEQLAKRRKEEEAHRQNEELRKKAEEMRREQELKRAEEERKRAADVRRSREEAAERKRRARRVDDDDFVHADSPPVPSLINNNRNNNEFTQNAAPSTIVDSGFGGSNSTAADTSYLPKERPAERTRSRDSGRGGERVPSAQIMSQLAAMRQQLQSERAKVEQALNNKERATPDASTEFTVAKSNPGQPPGSPRSFRDVFVAARSKAPVTVLHRQPATPPNRDNLREFTKLKDNVNPDSKDPTAADRAQLMRVFPEYPTSSDTLDAQQRILIKQQTELLEKLGKGGLQAGRGSSPGSKSRLASESDFLGVNAGAKALSPTHPDSQGIQETNEPTDDISLAASNYVSMPPLEKEKIPFAPAAIVENPAVQKVQNEHSARLTKQKSLLDTVSLDSLDPDLIAEKNRERMRTYAGPGDSVSVTGSLGDPDDVLNRFMAKHSHVRPPSNDSAHTANDDTWLSTAIESASRDKVPSRRQRARPGS